MLRPSLPMMRPFISSLGSSMKLTVDSTTFVDADPFRRLNDQVQRLAVGLFTRLLFDATGDRGPLGSGVLLDRRNQRTLGLVRRHPGHLLQRGLGLLQDLRGALLVGFGLLLEALQLLALILQPLAPLLQLALLPFQLGLDLG